MPANLTLDQYAPLPTTADIVTTESHDQYATSHTTAGRGLTHDGRESSPPSISQTSLQRHWRRLSAPMNNNNNNNNNNINNVTFARRSARLERRRWWVACELVAPLL
jgi:hypothetical protein